MGKDPKGAGLRKSDHIRIALEHGGFQTGSPLFECVTIIPRPLTGLGLQDIEISQKCFGKALAAPILIDALTGGTDHATQINSRLAAVAEKYHVAFGVGSQRIGLGHQEAPPSFRVIRKEAPTAMVFGNIGFAQLEHRANFDSIAQLMSQIEADALSIHINPLQELVQIDGDHQFRGNLTNIAEFKDFIGIPVILKETGAGLSREFVARAVQLGFKHFNLGGFGGTNFALIEAARAKDASDVYFQHVGEALKSWGIPTAASIMETRPSIPGDGTLIASGGVRTGLDIAKSVSLGADLAGIAFPFLEKAIESSEAIERYLDQLIYALKTAMLLAGAPTLAELERAPHVLHPPLENWKRQRVNNHNITGNLL